MNSTTTRYKMLASALLVSGLGWFGSANAADYPVALCAGQYTQTVDGVPVVMWGYSEGVPTAGLCPGVLSSPGPAIEVPVGDSLTVTLYNTLDEPTSLIIPGQVTTMTPVMAGDRVRSFTHETLAGNSDDYAWSSIEPGTYAYQSGTHPSVQVQMGLYGAMTNDAATGEAYLDPDGLISYAYDVAETLIYSEIDPAMHADIVNDVVGTYDGNATSTIGYTPRYFLVNGEVYDGGNQDYAISGPGETTLIRFINMGLKMHAPTLNGLRVQVVAEDGNVYPDYRSQYSLRLGAGKTKDALISVPIGSEGASYAVYDRMLNLSNNGVAGASGAVPGGMMSFLNVPGTGGTAVATVTTDPVVFDIQLIGAADPGTATPGPGDDLGTGDPVIPAGSGGTSGGTTVVSTVNEAPVAADDDAGEVARYGTVVIAALDNDSDDGGLDAGSIVITNQPLGRHGSATANDDGTITFTSENLRWAGGTPRLGKATFQYTVMDHFGEVSNEATVTVKVQ